VTISTMVSCQLNVVKDPKRTNPIVGLGEVTIWLARKRFPADI